MTKSKTASILVLFFFALILITDFHYKIISRLDIETFKLTLPTKFLVGVFLGYYIIAKKLLDKKDLIYLALFGVVILLGVTLQNQRYSNQELYIIAQYLFGIIVFMFFFKSQNKLDLSKLEKALPLLIWLNFGCILMAIAFDLQIFRTYTGTRFGYNGFLKSTSTASFFYMFSTLYLLIKKDKKKQTKSLLLITLLSALLVGSKTLFAFVTIVLIFYLLRHIEQMQSYMSTTFFYITSAVILMILGVYLFIPLISFNNTLYEVLINDGVISALFSYRDEHIANALSQMTTNYDISNYLFGGLSEVKRLTEVAGIDIFLTFGVTGAIVFFILFFKNLTYSKNPILKIFLTVIFCFIMLRGNFFYFPSVIYLALAIFTLTVNRDYNQTQST